MRVAPAAINAVSRRPTSTCGRRCPRADRRPRRTPVWYVRWLSTKRWREVRGHERGVCERGATGGLAHRSAFAADPLPGPLDEAARQELSLRDLVVFLCRTELAGRRRNRALLRLKQARFPMVRELDDFDFEAQPSVNPDQLRDLGTARWVGHGENVLMPGPPGVGKTHLGHRSSAGLPYNRIAVSASSPPRCS